MERTQDQFSAHISGSSQLPVIPVSGVQHPLLVFTGTCTHMHNSPHPTNHPNTGSYLFVCLIFFLKREESYAIYNSMDGNGDNYAT